MYLRGLVTFTHRFLQLEYRFDRLNEFQRLAFGLLAILMLGACWLYVLGIGSVLLLDRVEEPEVVTVVGTAGVIYVTVQATAAAGEPAALEPTPAATPAVDDGGNLINPPEVPEVAIVPAPRIYTPAQPLKPRVVATPVVIVAPTANGTVPARTVTPGTPVPLPTRPAVQNGGSPVPVVPTARAVATVGRTAVTGPPATPTRLPVSTPNAPPLVPTATPRTAATTAPPLPRR